jgi:outer membrane protein TolC
VGPQRFKVGLSQTFPWPSKLSAGANAQAEHAQAKGLAFDAELLLLKRTIAEAYWTLWLIHEEHRLKSEHDAVLEALAGAVRGRLKTGAASLADLNQVELNIARHHDHRGQHHLQQRKVSAQLLAAMGLPATGKVQAATDTPRQGLPSIADAELRAMARAHPHVRRYRHLATSEDYRASSERADRYPRFRLAMAGVPDSGKDPIIVSAGIALPLWAGNYSDSEDAAKAASAAHRAEGEAAERMAEGRTEAAIADVRDAQRRIELFEKTLVPQAESTFQAVLGGYQTGRSTVAAVILAQRDLLELQLEHARARVAHAKSWTRLEYIVGSALQPGGGQ